MENDKTKFPTKKDMTYWILMIVLLLTVVSVWKTNDPESLTNQLSLGGTLLSIFLAIIAIIFSFIQSSDTNSHNKEMIGKMDALTNSLKYLDELNDEKSQEIATKSTELDEIKSLLESVAIEVNNVRKQTQNDQMNSENLNNLVQKIEESQKKYSNSNLSFEIKVFNPDTLYDFLVENYKKRTYIRLKTIATKFNETNNMKISESDIMKVIGKLENEGKVSVLNDKTGLYLTLN